MEQRKNNFFALIVRSIAVLLAICFAFCFTDETVNIASKLVILSVKSFLPEKGITFFKAEADESRNEDLTGFSTEPVSKTEAEKTAMASGIQPLSAVDSDVAAAMQKAAEKSGADKKDGDIYEYTFTDEGVTDSFLNVKVKNVNKTQISIEKKLAEELELELESDQPAVLLYHTHTTETYQLVDRDFYAQGFLSRSNDEALNMVRVGKAVKQELEAAGIKVIHDTAVYDNPYSGAYYRSMDAAESWLEKYPSIRITLDIHRDAIQNDSGVKTKPTAVINSKKAAQIMIITGCQEEGNGITDLPEWEKNLTFALKLQRSMESLYPGLTRPVYFCPRSYNMSLTPMSLLIEMGTDANTLSEAVYSGRMLGRAVAKLISEEAVWKDGS